MNGSLAICLVACVLEIFTSGCVATRIDQPEASWPKPIVATDLKQFDGVYRDSALEILESGEAAPNTTELFVFLLGPKHAHEGDDHHVEIRSSPDGKQLRINLFDRTHHQIDSALLNRDIDFTLSDGAIVLQRSTGFETTSSNWGPGLEKQYSQIRVTTDGSLTGQDARSGVQLLMDVIPVAEAYRYYWFWPREAE